MTPIRALVSEFGQQTFTVRGRAFRFHAMAPVPTSKLDDKERRLGWPLPLDYREMLRVAGPAHVFGATMVPMERLRGRIEYDRLPDGTIVRDRVRCYLPFAERATETSARVLFAYAFELDLARVAGDIAAVARGEVREPFHGAPSSVVMCKVEADQPMRLSDDAQWFARDFTDWCGTLVSLLRRLPTTAAA